MVKRLATVLILSTIALGQLSHKASADASATSYDTARPKTLETGTEMFQQNQGFLKCAEAVLLPEFKHGNTDDMFSQVATLPDGSRVTMMVGHGAPGLQCTGKGDVCTGDLDVELAYFNQNTWRPSALKILKDFSSITLMGCEVGKGRDGLDLLHRLADTIQMSVRAPDSFIFCDVEKGIYLDDGGRWIEVSPQKQQPKQSQPAKQPSQAGVNRAGKGEYQFSIEGQMQNMPASSVEILDFRHRGYRDAVFKIVPRSALGTLKELIDFSHPLVKVGSPAAIVTGVFHIQFSANGKKNEREFLLLNDELAADNVQLGVYYRANAKLLQTIEASLK